MGTIARMALLPVTALLLMMPPAVPARPRDSSEEQRYGSWGSFSGLGGSFGGSASGSLGTNFGLGFSHRKSGQAGEDGLNLFSSNTGAFAGSGNFNLGLHSGGYRHPVAFAGQPGLGGWPGFGGQPGVGVKPGVQDQPGFGSQPGTGPVGQPEFRPPQTPGQSGRPGTSRGRDEWSGAGSLGSSEEKTGEEFGSSGEVMQGRGLIDPRAQVQVEQTPKKKKPFFQRIRDFFG